MWPREPDDELLRAPWRTDSAVVVWFDLNSWSGGRKSLISPLIYISGSFTVSYCVCVQIHLSHHDGQYQPVAAGICEVLRDTHCAKHLVFTCFISPEKPDIIYSQFQYVQLRFRDVRWWAQDHTAREWQILNAGPDVSRCHILYRNTLDQPCPTNVTRATCEILHFLAAVVKSTKKQMSLILISLFTKRVISRILSF